MYHDIAYLDALTEILDKGKIKGDRTGTGTISRFGMQMRFDLSEGFPLLTTKKVHFKSIIWELLWLIRGETNVKWLKNKGVNIWNDWADENGELGPVYGAQWRRWAVTEIDCTMGRVYDSNGDSHNVIDYDVSEDEIDQLAQVVETLKTNPNDRRMIVSAWNVADVPKMALPPCHLLFQFWVWEGQLSCQMYQRSCDMFLGVPFNIASYSALIHLLCHVTGLKPGEFIWTGGDCHVYNNHIAQVNEQLSRVAYEPPTLTIAPDAPKGIDGEWHLDHFQLENYNCHPAIKAPISV